MLELAARAALLEEFMLAFLGERNLEDSMRIFYRILSAHIPFTQMLFLSFDKKRQVVIPWVVMENGEVVEAGGSMPRLIDGTLRMERVFEDGDLRIVMENDIRRNRLMDPYTDMFLHGKQSIMSVSLQADTDRMFGISLHAPEPHRFNRGHVDILLVMREPLRVLASRLHSVSQQSLLAETSRLRGQESAFALLKQCRGLASVIRQIETVADTNCTVLIQGETGVGKELAADSIHHLSSRRKGPFVRVNCASIPETLLDTALYGHEKGSFTNAVDTHRGYFEQASGGTLFLDEVGELAPAAQARLLRVLESRTVQRVGGSRIIHVDVRVLAATNRDLRAMVEDGSFREDLWYRLMVFLVTIPPLRRRREDIVTLVRHFHMVKAAELGLKQPAMLTPDVLNALCAYSWPGNVRQLAHVMERALLVAQGERSATLSFSELPTEAPRRLKRLGSPNPEQAKERAVPVRREPSVEPLNASMAEHIRRALKACGGRIHGPEGAARLLGVNPNTLRGRMKRLGIVFRKQDMAERN